MKFVREISKFEDYEETFVLKTPVEEMTVLMFDPADEEFEIDLDDDVDILNVEEGKVKVFVGRDKIKRLKSNSFVLAGISLSGGRVLNPLNVHVFIK